MEKPTRGKPTFLFYYIILNRFCDVFTRHISAYLGDLLSNSSMRLLPSILLSLSGLHTCCKEEGLCRTFKSTYVQVSYEMILLCFYPSNAEYPLSILGTRYGGLWPLLWKEIPALWLVCWRFERQYCTALLLVLFIQGNKFDTKKRPSLACVESRPCTLLKLVRLWSSCSPMEYWIGHVEHQYC